jgi:hypothetical protein
VELHFAGGGQWANHIPSVAAKNQVQMSLLFHHLATLGYGITSREDNPDGNIGCCSEYSFLRVEQVASLSSLQPGTAGRVRKIRKKE